MFDRLVRSPPVVQEVRKRTFRGIDRPVETPEEDVEPPYMVAMFVGDQYRIDRPGIDTGASMRRRSSFVLRPASMRRAPLLPAITTLFPLLPLASTVQRIACTIRPARIRVFDPGQPGAFCGTDSLAGAAELLQKPGMQKKGDGTAGESYFFGLSALYSARTGAIVFVDMERRTSVVSFRQ